MSNMMRSICRSAAGGGTCRGGQRTADPAGGGVGHGAPEPRSPRSAAVEIDAGPAAGPADWPPVAAKSRQADGGTGATGVSRVPAGGRGDRPARRRGGTAGSATGRGGAGGASVTGCEGSGARSRAQGRAPPTALARAHPGQRRHDAHVRRGGRARAPPRPSGRAVACQAAAVRCLARRPQTAHLDVVEEHRDLAERSGDRVLRRRRCRSRASGGRRAEVRGRRGRRWAAALLASGSSRRPPLALHVHQVLDALADLGRDQLHPLRQITGERLGFVAGGFPHGRGVADVGVERHGAERDDGQEEERDDEAEAKAQD